MKINIEIEEADINFIKKFVKKNNNPFLQSRIARNVHRKNIVIDKSEIIRAILMCLLTTQQRSGPNTTVSKFLGKKPCPINESSLKSIENVEGYIQTEMKKNGLNRYINKIPVFFNSTYKHLENTEWLLLHELTKMLNEKSSKEYEREIADKITDTFAGFGPKQSRNFLQSLGLSRYEIPIDSRIINWLNDFGFPIVLSSIALQDKKYYHFVLDCIQILCEKAEILPCVLDAAIFSSYDNDGWTEENTVY